MKSRLDKLLADNGLGSRRDIKRLLREGRCVIDGKVCTDAARYVESEDQSIVLDGKPFVSRSLIYIMLNKPSGVVTSTDDPVHQTVIDLLPSPWKARSLFPVGRLDRDTEGLLLLTNDGPLTHRLTSPKSGCIKVYRARLGQPVDEEAFSLYQKRFTQGIQFHDGYTCKSAVVERGEGVDEMIVHISEGKYHQVKKMFKALGNEVVYLKRLSMGSLILDESLAPGSIRELTGEEVAALREGYGPAD